MHVQHRDLKPSNILKIRENWYLSDFGLAKMIESQEN
jgi:serine/threonine protein kinase